MRVILDTDKMKNGVKKACLCMKNYAKKAYLCPIFIGIVLILAGLIIQIPGGVLTTYKSLDGDSTNLYVFDNKYSSIDEYVGGDAYNYIIGASLVAGKTAGAIAAKAISMVGGTMCICLGITLMMLQKNRPNEVTALNSAETSDSAETSSDHENGQQQAE